MGLIYPLVVGSLLLSVPTFAQDAGQMLPKSSKKEKMNVLDFEGEVIEGERKKPDLILQVAPQDLNFDNLLYNRSDFNDFLEVDQNTRPRFIIKSKK